MIIEKERHRSEYMKPSRIGKIIKPEGVFAKPPVNRS